ncbi:MAG: glutathione S-transferase family protein [Chthoniobacterales bacterium]
MKAQFPEEQSETGEFQRQEDEFRDWVSQDGSTEYPAVVGRYHLYISLACPWASRTFIVRKVKGLEEAIGMTVVDPVRDERGWAFRDPEGTIDSSSLRDDATRRVPASTDPVNGFAFLSEAYTASDRNFRGRVTVPVLWDKQGHRIVNNSEDDICRMFNDAFESLGRREVNLFPDDIADEQEKLSNFVYENINNGVYRAGFATKQAAYERACRRLFKAFDEIEQRLTTSRYLFGPRIVETDWRLFCTLVRFDAVYYSHFKCNLRRIVDYPNLHGYLLDLYQQPGIAETVNLDHIKRHYYITHAEINPTRIVPLGPLLDFTQRHGREKLSS